MRFVLLFIVALLIIHPAPARGEGNPPGLSDELVLSPEEGQWLREHPVIRVSTGNVYEDYFAAELRQGMASDYLKAAFRRLGLKFEAVPGLNVQRSVELLGKSGGVDVALNIPLELERVGQVEFTMPFLRSPQVIFTRKDGHFVAGIADLAGRTVAVTRRQELTRLLVRDIPRVRILVRANSAEALQSVSSGRADAYVGSLAPGTFGIERIGALNLKVAAPAPYPDDQLAIGVRKDWPELARLINKALASLPPEEHDAIRHRWLTLRYEHGIRSSDVAKWISFLVILALVAILGMRQVIRMRTADLLREVELRAQRERELEREKGFVEQVIESLPVIFYLHKGGKFVRWNSALERASGFTPAELSSPAVPLPFHEDDRALSREKMAEVMERGEAQWEARFTTREGVRHFLVTGKKVELDGATYVIGTAGDISEKKLGELALKESERRFTEMLENLRLIAIMFDRNERVTFCNDYLLELTGWERSEVLGKNWFDMFYPDAEESRRSFHQAIGNGIYFLHRERTILTHQGGRRIISWNSTVLRTPEGEEIGVACIGEDVTDRRQYEIALQIINAGVSSTTGTQFFQALVSHLARALEVQYAIVAELGDEARWVSTVAVCAHGELLPNFSYTLDGTPCEQVERNGMVLLDGGVQELYPGVCFLSENGIESFAGVNLTSASGEFLGTLTVLATGHFSNPELVEAMLGVFAGRAAAEMERTRAEQALKQSEEKYRLLFDRMLNGYAVAEVMAGEDGSPFDFRLLEANESFATLMGFPREEMIGRTLTELIPNAEQSWITRLGEVALTEKADQFEAYSRFLRKWLKVAVYSPCKGQFAATFSDISKRKVAEQAVLQSEEHVRQIFAQSDDGLILFEMDTFRIVEANPAALKLYGATMEQFKQAKPWEFISPSDFRRVIRGLAREEQSSGFQLDRATCYRSGGGSFTVAIRGKILVLRNEYVILCSIRDITAKARLEDEMKATQARLIQANKMTSLGMLVSGIAHEINNPNNFISVNSLMLTDVWQETAPILAEHRERSGEFFLGGLPYSEMEKVVPRLLSGITEGSNRIATIVGNMRNFVKKEDGGTEGVIDINRTIDGAASLLWHHIHRYTDDFSMSLSEGLPVGRGSSQQIEQVIINLIMNALQALPGKECAVRVESGFDEGRAMVTIAVIDEGYGMNKKVQKRLTEPFFSTKIDKGGTGLGLYISSSIIQEHRGTLSFQSAPGKGTTAVIRLPVASLPVSES
ncbi:hypothetical protein GMSM_03050 [Geomonas sp. Red276]